MIENVLNSHEELKEKKKGIKYTKKQRMKFNEILKGIIDPAQRMKVYGQYVRNEYIIPEDPKQIPKPKPNKEIIYQKEQKIVIPKQELSKKWLIFFIVWLILGLIGLGIFIIYLSVNKTLKKRPTPEELVSGLTYQENQIMKFQNVKTTKINYEFGNADIPNESRTLVEYTDFIIGIISKDKIVENDVEKEIFSSYVFLENYMIDNGTEKMLMQNSSLFEEALALNNLRSLWELRNMNKEEKKYFNFSINDVKLYCCIDNGTLPIMKFDFYKNGKIRKIYKPKNLIILFYDLMVEIMEKVIPRIAKEDFNETYNNISEALQNEYEKIKNNSIKENSTDELKEKYDNRNLEANDTYKNVDIENNTFEHEEVNKIITQEFDNENDFNVYMFDKAPNEEKTNLNYYTHSPVRNEFAEFRGSQQNTSINATIDEKEKSLKEVHYINKGKLVNDTNFGEELENERQKSCSNDNLLDCQDMADDTYENVIDSKFKSIDYEIIEDIFSTGNYLDNKKHSINKFNEIFKKYENKLEIKENYERANSSRRLLRDITDYVLANKFEFEDVEMEIGDGGKKRNLDEYSEYYGMKDMEYSKNLFSLNILGIQMKLQITNTMIVKEGKSVVKIKLQFAFIKISITIKTIKTNMHLAIRNYNEMGYTQLYLINESIDKLGKRNEKYSEIILNLEKNFNSLLIDKHDFSNIFKDSFSDMYEKIKNFTSDIFQEFINIIRNASNNFTEILDNVRVNKHEVFNEIRIITKNEYINFINKMLLLVEDFNNKTCIFLLEVKEEVAKIENFQLDLLYDLIDIIYETKKIFKDFNKNLFLAIEKGIKVFRLDFQDFIYEMMGDLLYLVDFLSINLNKNDILKNSMDIETREELILKLKNMKNIINIIKETLLQNIDNDYKEEMDEKNINSIKIYSEEKLKECLIELEEKSMKIIEDIKNKIAFINLYELYTGNVDKIEEITNEVNKLFYSDLYGDIIEKVKLLKPEYLNNNSILIEKKEKLFEIVNLIDTNINEEVREINKYIISYTKDFKIKRQYNIYYNIYNFRKSFIGTSMEKLRLSFNKLINDTVLISIQGIMTKNYNLGIQWLEEIAERLVPLHKRDECLQKEFYNKYSMFIKVYESFLPNAYNDKIIDVYRKYFNIIRNDILTTVRSKMSKINYFYFNISIYKDNFYFISQINKEIEYLLKNLENYYSDDYFDSKLAIYIYEFTSKTLGPVNDKLHEKFEELRKKCEKYTDCVRNREWGDYCWNNNRVLKDWHYIDVPHTDNYKNLETSFNNVENFIKTESSKIINKFINGFSNFLNSYLKEIQILFDDLYNYTEKKIKTNEGLDNLINQYLEILDTMNEIAENEINFDEKNIEFYLQNINNKTKDMKADFFENYYLKNFSSYLEYPVEVLYKVINMENELKSSSEIVKLQINYIMNKKIWRIKEENYYFIAKTQDFFSNLIKSNLKKVKIFDYYKENRLQQKLRKILEKYNFNNINGKDILTENNYNNNIKKTINEYKRIVSNIEERIINDWIFKNCSKINDTYNSDRENKTRLICLEYKNKSSLNYSEYNFNVVKIRVGIYYLKYLYENFESLFEDFNFDYLLNSSLIIQKDEIINDKYILNLYEKSIEKIAEFNQESEDLLEDYFYYFKEDINETIKNELDFTENFKKFAKILKFNENNFVFEVNKKINESTSDLLELLYNYNDTLSKQINMAKKYEKFNFNSKNFKKVWEMIPIEKSFDNIKNNIKNIIGDFVMNNTLKIKLESLNYKKAQFFRNIIEDLNKNYEIKPFNLTFDIGKKTEKFICNVLDDMMFSYIYEYIELYEANINTFINSLIKIVDGKKKEMVYKFNEITNNFLDELKIYSTEYINNDYLMEYKNNYTLCLNYSINNLNQTLEKDKQKYNKYIIYQHRLNICLKAKKNICKINDIDVIELNITDSNIIEILDKLNKKQHINLNLFINSKDFSNNTEKEMQDNIKELNDYLNDLCDTTINSKYNFINETKLLLDCDNNNYYINYLNLTYFDNFDIEILNKLLNISSEINKTISSFHLGGKFLENYLFSNDYIELQNYSDFSVNIFKYNLENFQDMAEYINYKIGKKYFEFLKESLYEAFSTSFTEFMKNAISGYIEDNLIIYIIGKIDINMEYIKEKVKNEKGYYSLLLNNTNELGVTSINSFISLYDYIYDKINKTLHYQIEDYISDNINFFYRENKFIFKEIFINYYFHNLNKMFGTENIFSLETFLEEFILDRDFNKTLENISKELWSKLLIDKLNYNLENKLNSIIGDLSDLLKTQQKEIKKELEKIKIVQLYESMLLLAEMIDNYTNLVNEQNNRFKFLVSDLPLKKFGYFSQSYLEPPLDEIKRYYDMIQNELLKKINEIVNQMKDFNEEIKSKYNITEQMNKMFDVLKRTYDTLVNYSNIFIDDINEYDEILVLYTYISKSSHTLRQLNNYLKVDNKSNIKLIRNKYNFTNDKSMNKNLKRIIAQNKTKNNSIYQIYNNINMENKYIINKNNNENKKMINLNYTKSLYKNRRRRLSSHSNRGSITSSILNKESQKFKKTLNIFNKTYLSKDYLKIQTNWLKEESKINRYIINSGRTIELAALKLSSIITQDKIDSLEGILYFKHKQISNHINMFINLTNNQIKNYLSLLNNSSEMLDMTFKEVNQIIIVSFNILKEMITGQITEMKNMKEKNEEIDGNERLYNLYNKEDFYQPIGIKIMNNKNDTKKNNNLKKSQTITKNYNLLKYAKHKVFNSTEKKFNGINNIFKEAKKYAFNRRRIEQSSSSNGGSNSNNNGENSNSNNENNNENENNNKDKDESDLELEMEYDLMQGKLSFELNYCLDEDFDLQNITIPIIGILSMVLEPELNIGFCFSISLKAKVHKTILNTQKILEKTEIKEEDDDDDEDDTKLELKVLGKAEMSLSVSAGIIVCDTKIFYMAFLAGIKGLLGKGEIGFSLTINFNKGDIIIDKFAIYESFYISLFLKIAIEINTGFAKFKFNIYIFNIPLFGIKNEEHDTITKILGKMIYEDFIEYNKYQLP